MIANIAEPASNVGTIGLPEDAQQLTRRELQILHKTQRRIEAAMKIQTQRVFEIGRLLSHAKAQVSHGGFLQWIDSNLPFKHRTAQLYMRVAGVLGEHEEHLGTFQMSTLDALAAKALGDEARAELIAEIASGKLTTDDAVLARINPPDPELISQTAALKTRRYEARVMAARLTCEIAGDRINEIIDLLRTAGLKEFATAIEEVVTAPASDPKELKVVPEAAGDFAGRGVDATTTEEADPLPDFMLNVQ
jgi:hypothetical protein